jgi:nitrate reductase NapD
MNISSVVIRCLPEQLAAVRLRLAALAGVEVHGENPEGRLVITLEDSDVCTAADTYVALHDLPGVLSATLVYQYADDGPSPVTANTAFPKSEVNQEEVMP